MSDAQGQSASAWRQLEGEWAEACEQWHDSTADFFARHYWEPLEAETESFQRALEELMETLRAAQEAVRT
jgi:uncharacterized protein YukE